MWRSRLAANFHEIKFLVHPTSQGSAGARAFVREEMPELMVLNLGLHLEVAQGPAQKARLLALDTSPNLHAWDLENDSAAVVTEKLQFLTESLDRMRREEEADDVDFRKADPAGFDKEKNADDEAMVTAHMKEMSREARALLQRYGPFQVKARSKGIIKPPTELDGYVPPEFLAWQQAQRQKSSKRA